MPWYICTAFGCWGVPTGSCPPHVQPCWSCNVTRGKPYILSQGKILKATPWHGCVTWYHWVIPLRWSLEGLLCWFGVLLREGMLLGILWGIEEGFLLGNGHFLVHIVLRVFVCCAHGHDCPFVAQTLLQLSVLCMHICCMHIVTLDSLSTMLQSGNFRVTF